MIGRQIAQQFGLLSRRVALLVGRGILRMVDDAPGCQRVQSEFFAGEVRDAMERVQDYGFTSVPQAGHETLAGSTACGAYKTARSHSMTIWVSGST
jgi:phage gp45-like